MTATLRESNIKSFWKRFLIRKWGNSGNFHNQWWHTQVPSTWSETVEPTEVVEEVVLPGVSNLKDSVINKNEGDRRQFYSEKKNLEKEFFFGIFWNFVPNITVTYNDEDTICINEKIQSKRKSKNKLCKIYMKNGRIWNDFSNLENSITGLNELLSTTKESYYEHLGRKLNNLTIQT